MSENTKTIQSLTSWSLPVVGYGKMITEPIFKNGWYIVPLEQYTNIIPKLAIESVEQIKQSGVEIEGFVIATRMNEPPTRPPQDASNTDNLEELITKVEKEASRISEIVLVKAVEVGKAILPVAKTVGKVILTVAGAIGVLLGIVLIIGLAGACLSNDPVLIVVLKDGTWVEVMRW
uniref:Uncharacterized protein n=1 Tax=candidate division CPR3 bacterium TaxID=2268181 RepID=A0A7V3N605_UNCC3